jgi:predicted DNA-binding transcriptional regulator YafY
MSTTTTRLLNLLSLLQTRRDWPGSLLADRLEISDRTVRRDIDRLREMGYSIRATMGPDGGYRLEAGSDLPPLLFDDDQTVAIAVALQTASVVGVGIEEAAIRALATIRQVMPSRLRHRLDALEVIAIAQRPGEAPPTDVSMDLLVSLATTIRAREVLRFDYATRGVAPDAQSPRPARRVELHHLVTAQGRWYLVAWDLDREDWRLLRIDRVTPRTPNGPRFAPREVPGGDVNEFVSARFKGSDVNEWPCRGTVILQLPVSAVLPFLGDGTVRRLGEDRCILEAGSWSWGALAASFGRYEVPMEVIGPAELVDACAVLAERYRTTAATSDQDRSALEALIRR